MLKSGDNFTIC